MEEKKCKKCNEVKLLIEFGKHARRKDGIDTYCKKCKIVMSRKYQAENKEKVKHIKKISDSKWYDSNKDKKLATNKKWKEDNIDHNRKWYREYKSNRQKNDVNFKLISNIRTRLWYAIKDNYKSGSAVRDLDCTIPEFKSHIESLFQEGMAWENWSLHGWHIDHIVPLSTFDLSNREELLKACHYTNLQPLWAKDNLSKSNKTS